ncbi:MAG: DUF4123 domain-containing protein [Novosphingobium sp.]|nr:DUF4123 domain-containing protein [Novosphingobium sp.]
MPGPGLYELVAGWPAIIAVCNGAKFADLPAILQAGGFTAHSLILESPRQPAPRSGPWMLPLSPERLGQFLSIPGMQPSCVLWGGVSDPGVAFQHFRRINRARIVNDEKQPESVLFRHWDNETLGLMLPLMTPAQKARLFGPFERAAFFVEDAEGGVVALRESGTAPADDARRGPIHFDASQMATIEAGMLARSDRKIARYLRRNAAAHTGPADDEALQRYVGDCRAQAGAWGITSESGIGRFAWLQLVTQGRFAGMPEVHALMTAPSTATPDRKLKYLMQRMSRQAQGLD